MRFRFPSRLALVLLDGGWSMRFPHLARYRRGSKWIFRYGEAETPPLPNLLWLFGMYVAMQLRYGYDIRAFTHAHSRKYISLPKTGSLSS
jgi:hypothetical protein